MLNMPVRSVPGTGPHQSDFLFDQGKRTICINCNHSLLNHTNRGCGALKVSRAPLTNDLVFQHCTCARNIKHKGKDVEAANRRRLLWEARKKLEDQQVVHL